MTYLEAVNRVLVRLRESQVTTVESDEYSSLIGQFVQDAHKFVEDSWDWSNLRRAITVSTVDGTHEYTLTGSGERMELLYAINDTSKLRVEYQTPAWFETNLYLNTPVSGAPAYYTFDGLDSSRDTKIKIYPVPDGVYSLRFTGIYRTTDLSADTDTLTIPQRPVIDLAVAFATRERGETGGTSAAELFAIADRSLSDAIALDAGKNPEQLVFEAV